jgi:hypothetical protein
MGSIELLGTLLLFPTSVAIKTPRVGEFVDFDDAQASKTGFCRGVAEAELWRNTMWVLPLRSTLVVC